MAINPALLIAAPILQDYFSDNATDAAMSAGVITCYQDNSRTTLKNWYYQSGTPGAYTYIPLPNPLTLSAQGTIEDAMGNDTIPFWYPYSETDNQTLQPYYVTCVNSNGQVQFTRQNFPFIPVESGGNSGTPTLENYIANNVFWRNIGSLNAGTLSTDPISGQLSAVLAPSQHDGFSMPDLQYIKSTNGATETITFTPFGLGNDPLQNDITPEFYINHDCTASQAGETLKCYQFPISLHVKTLESVAASITLQAQNVGTSTNNMITIAIYQFLGTGVTSPSPIVLQTIALTNSWQKYVIPFVFPSASGLTLGNGGDDALYLQIGMPLAVTCDINFTKPAIYLSNTVPTNDFDTYDDIDTIINSPRTGDLRTSINNFYPFGWVPMNNGTIGNASSNATSRANTDTWPLFSRLWSKFSNFNNSTTNVLAQMVSSAGSAVTYGASAIADWNANKAITLSQTMGKVLLGTAPVASLLSTYTTTFTASSNVLTTSNNVNFFNGMPVYFTGTGTLSTTAIYYVSGFNGTTGFYVSTTFANAMAGTVVTVASDSGTIVSAFEGTFEGEYSHTQLTAELAAHTHNIELYTAAGAMPPSHVAQGSSTDQGVAATTTSTGSGTPFNVTQPGQFFNIFMKL